MSAPILSPVSENLGSKIQGVWWLLTREDWTLNGQKKVDPILGSDPVGILSYSPNHFAAQFMKRDRSGDLQTGFPYSVENNTIAVGGYDAYFGTYEVDEQSGKVIHTLIGSVTPSNIGMSVSRDLRVDNDRLVIQLQTTTPEGEQIIRTLTWKRLS